MVSKIVPPSTPASQGTTRSQNRIEARLEAREDLNYAHMQSVMRDNRRAARKARKQSSKALKELADPTMALQDQTTSPSRHRRRKPSLHIETKPVRQGLRSHDAETIPCAVEHKRRPVSSVYGEQALQMPSMNEGLSLRSPYPEMNPYASKQNQSRVSAHLRKVSADCYNSSKGDLQSQNSRASWVTISVNDFRVKEDGGSTLVDANSPTKSACIHGDYSFVYDEYQENGDYSFIYDEYQEK